MKWKNIILSNKTLYNTDDIPPIPKEEVFHPTKIIKKYEPSKRERK